jgi:hypothetical protein
LNVDPDALATELRSLRRGLGARHPGLARRLGEQLRQLCGIAEDDGPATARRRLADVVESLLRDESRTTRLAITAALALHPEADQRHLAARQRWLAAQLSFHERTARRRIDEAIDLLARRAAENGLDGEAADAWQVQSIHAVLRLDGDSPELTERRTVVMTRDDVSEIVTRFSLPRSPGTGEPHDHDLHAEVLFGGRIRERHRLSPEHFRFVIELPRRHQRGETHDYGIRFSIPPGQAMAPHYALTPLLTVRSLDLTVRFDPARPPARIWRLDGVAPRMIDYPSDRDQVLPLDRFGEVQVSFRNMHQGLCYGAGWQFPEDGA